MKKKKNNSFGAGTSFGKFKGSVFNGSTPKVETYKVQPIEGAFGGSIPNSLYTVDRESTWSRWRRGYELGAANLTNTAYEYPFEYIIPTTTGAVDQIGAREPLMSGVFRGFPTKNKELGIHWAGKIEPGNLRFDRLEDSTGTLLSISGEINKNRLYLGVPQENQNYWYIQLSGTFSTVNPVPPPLFVTFSGTNQTLKPIVGDIIEDKILTVSGQAINIDSRDPTTNRRFGFVQAVLVGIDQYQGILKLEKLGSVQGTIDGILATPARRPPHSGRFFQTGPRYCCSCQDFTRRDYAYLSSLGVRRKPLFPRANVASIKPGRIEEVFELGQLSNAMMTEVNDKVVKNRTLTIVAPSGYELAGVGASGIVKDVRDPKTLYRDSPGQYNDFGKIYRRGFGDNPSLTQVAEGMPKYGDYKQSGLDITEISDDWTYVLDQYRYCKHIYAMKYIAGEFPIEPSDFPIDAGLMSEWENMLIDQTILEQTKSLSEFVNYGVSHMDIPPFNCQSPTMIPMLQKLFNFPSEFIELQQFIMRDKNGVAYIPASGQKPNADGQS